MNKKLIAAMMAAGFLSLSGAAQAQWSGNFERDIEDIVENAIDQYDELMVANIAVNTDDVDASVRIESDDDDVEIGGSYANLRTDIEVELEVEAEADTDDVGTATATATGTVAPELKAQVGSSITTSAIGAANVGDVTVTAVQEVEAEARFSAYESEREYRRYESETESVRASAEVETSNPDVGVFQVAYNDADIEADIDVEALEDVEIRNTDMKTSAIGALNAGDITVSVGLATLPTLGGEF